MKRTIITTILLIIGIAGCDVPKTYITPNGKAAVVCGVGFYYKNGATPGDVGTALRVADLICGEERTEVGTRKDAVKIDSDNICAINYAVRDKTHLYLAERVCGIY